MKKMKRAIKSKEAALAALLILSAALTGALFFNPELINANEPFIDLNSGIGNAIGNAEGAYKALNPSTSSEAESTVLPSSETSETDHAAIDANFGNYDIRVIVEGEAITKQEKGSSKRTEIDIKDLLEEFRSSHAPAFSSVLLIDDYADAKIFTRIIRALDAQGIPYDKERLP